MIIFVLFSFTLLAQPPKERPSDSLDGFDDMPEFTERQFYGSFTRSLSSTEWQDLAEPTSSQVVEQELVCCENDERRLRIALTEESNWLKLQAFEQHVRNMPTQENWLAFARRRLEDPNIRFFLGFGAFACVICLKVRSGR